MEIRPMRGGEREAVLDLLERVFEVRELFARYMDFDPLYAPRDLLLAVENGAPVSCVQVFEKRIRLRGEVVGLGGIGSVATDPEYRRAGLARRLLAQQQDAMRARGLALGLLFTERFDFYGKLGWTQIPAAQGALHRPARPQEPLAGLAFRSFREDDLPQVRRLYDRYSGRFEGPTVRDARYWQGQLRYAGTPGEDFRVAERGGRLVAYARAIELYRAPIAMEYGCEPEATDALAALLVELCPRDRELLVRLAPDPELESALRQRARRFERVDDPTLMWRVLDRPALARLAGLGEDAGDRELLRALIEDPPAHYWLSDRF